MKNKFIITCLTLLLAFAASSVHAVSYKDIVQDPNLERKLDILDGLGILNGEDESMFNEYGNISRGDFAFMAANLAGFGRSGASNNAVFSDIKAGTPLSERIGHLSRLRIVYGVGEGAFKPDSDITLNEAAVMLNRLLGYEAIDGYFNMNGPIQTLYSLGVIPNTGLKASDPITWKTAAEMLYNCLEADMVTTEYAAGAYPFYPVKNDVTPLGYYLNCGRGEGVITANSETRLDEPGFSGKDTVTIDGVDYNAGETDISSYLGYRVEFYYSDPEEDGGYTIKTFAPYRTKVLEVSADETEAYENLRLIYYPEDGERKATARISPAADVIFNGAAYPDYTPEDFKIDDGYIKLVDNDSDGAYDVIFINEYKSYVVNSVSRSANRIYLEGMNEPLDLTPDNYDRLRIFDENRGSAEFGDISADAVVTLAKDKTGKNLDLYISGKTVSGKITYMTDKRFEIDLIPYPYNKTFEEDLKYLTVSYQGEFLLDFEGRVTAVREKSSSDFRYGYYASVFDTENGDSDIRMKIFTDQGKFEIYPLAKKVAVDGGRLEKDEFLEDKRFITEGANTKFNMQLIKYKLSENGEIRTIITEASVSASESVLPEKMTRLDVSDVKYKAGPRYFAKKAYLTDRSLVFKVPTLDSTGFSEDAFSLNKVQFADSMAYPGTAAYDVDDGGEAPVLVYKTRYVVSDMIGGSDIPSDDAPCVIVKEVCQGVNRNGEAVPVVTFTEKGNDITLAAFTEATLKKPVFNADGSAQPDTYKYIAKGDIIQYVKNEYDEITGMKLCHDHERKDAGIYVKNNGETCGFDYGQVYSKGKSGIRMTSVWSPDLGFDTGEQSLTAFPVNNVSIVVYDEANDEIGNGTINDIRDYESCGDGASMAFARSKYYEIRELFIFQK